MSGLPVLMYHALEDDQHPLDGLDRGTRVYVLRCEQFEQQMELLHREGFRTFFLDELLNREPWPERALVLTFDDGHVSNSTLALPILQKYGFKAEFFITTDWIGTPGYLSVEQIATLSSAGMSIGSHGVSHRFLGDLCQQEVERELQGSMEALSAITGSRITSFSAPGGRLNPLALQLAQRLGYRIVYGSRPGSFRPGAPPVQVPRFDIRCDCDQESFRRLVQLDPAYLRRLGNRHRLLTWFKGALGNERYDRARNILLQLVRK